MWEAAEDVVLSASGAVAAAVAFYILYRLWSTWPAEQWVDFIECSEDAVPDLRAVVPYKPFRLPFFGHYATALYTQFINPPGYTTYRIRCPTMVSGTWPDLPPFVLPFTYGPPTRSPHHSAHPLPHLHGSASQRCERASDTPASVGQPSAAAVSGIKHQRNAFRAGQAAHNTRSSASSSLLHSAQPPTPSTSAPTATPTPLTTKAPWGHEDGGVYAYGESVIDLVDCVGWEGLCGVCGGEGACGGGGCGRGGGGESGGCSRRVPWWERMGVGKHDYHHGVGGAERHIATAPSLPSHSLPLPSTSAPSSSPAPPVKGIIVVVPGLTSSLRTSGYLRRWACSAASGGWGVIVVNHKGCEGDDWEEEIRTRRRGRGGGAAVPSRHAKARGGRGAGVEEGGAVGGEAGVARPGSGVERSGGGGGGGGGGGVGGLSGGTLPGVFCASYVSDVATGVAMAVDIVQRYTARTRTFAATRGAVGGGMVDAAGEGGGEGGGVEGRAPLALPIFLSGYSLGANVAILALRDPRHAALMRHVSGITTVGNPTDLLRSAIHLHGDGVVDGVRQGRWGVEWSGNAKNEIDTKGRDDTAAAPTAPTASSTKKGGLLRRAGGGKTTGGTATTLTSTTPNTTTTVTPAGGSEGSERVVKNVGGGAGTDADDVRGGGEDDKRKDEGWRADRSEPVSPQDEILPPPPFLPKAHPLRRPVLHPFGVRWRNVGPSHSGSGSGGGGGGVLRGGPVSEGRVGRGGRHTGLVLPPSKPSGGVVGGHPLRRSPPILTPSSILHPLTLAAKLASLPPFATVGSAVAGAMRWVYVQALTRSLCTLVLQRADTFLHHPLSPLSATVLEAVGGDVAVLRAAKASASVADARSETTVAGERQSREPGRTSATVKRGTSTSSSVLPTSRQHLRGGGGESRISSICAFDAAVVVPAFRFRSVGAYYHSSSSAHHLAHINIPHLSLTAADDPVCAPLLREAVAPAAARTPRSIFLQTRAGGHLGFAGRSVGQGERRGWGWGGEFGSRSSPSYALVDAHGEACVSNDLRGAVDDFGVGFRWCGWDLLWSSGVVTSSSSRTLSQWRSWKPSWSSDVGMSVGAHAVARTPACTAVRDAPMPPGDFADCAIEWVGSVAHAVFSFPRSPTLLISLIVGGLVSLLEPIWRPIWRGWWGCVDFVAGMFGVGRVVTGLMAPSWSDVVLLRWLELMRREWEEDRLHPNLHSTTTM